MSSGIVVCFFRLRINPGPKVRLGTKFPSITSRCSRSTIFGSNCFTSAPAVDRSPAIIEGAMSISEFIDINLQYTDILFIFCDKNPGVPHALENKADLLARLCPGGVPDPS